MEGYITRQTKWVKREVWDCAHYKVEKIWFTGAISINGIPNSEILTLNLLMKDGSRKEFNSENINESSEDLIIKAEEYLQTL